MKVQLLGEQDACCGSSGPLPYSSAPQFSDASVRRLDGSCTDLYQSLQDPQAPDVGEAKWVPDTKVSFMQNGEVNGRKGNCPRLEPKWVGNETHLVLLRHNLALGHSPELAGGAASNT